MAEAVAEQMLSKDPSLRSEFERRLEDPAFASNPAARLDFFYRRHSSWDERYNLYPVLRTSDPVVESSRGPSRQAALTPEIERRR